MLLLAAQSLTDLDAIAWLSIRCLSIVECHRTVAGHLDPLRIELRWQFVFRNVTPGMLEEAASTFKEEQIASRSRH